MRVTVLYVGTSLPGPLKEAERTIRTKNKINLDIALHNCGDSIPDNVWPVVERDLAASDIVFIIHVTNSENASRIISAIRPVPADAGTGRTPAGEAFKSNVERGAQQTVIGINCMPDVMRLTRMGKLDFGALMRSKASSEESESQEASAHNLARKLGSWMADSVRRRKGAAGEGSGKAARFQQYTSLIGRMPGILRFLPTAGKLTDIKHYIYLFCYFLQPTPANIRSMILYSIKHYVAGNHRLRIPLPEVLPATGIYYPDAPRLFESFQSFKQWYEKERGLRLERERTVGLLLMRPQVIGDSRGHYDRLIQAIEEEGLAVLPVLSTFMDNRQASREFFSEPRSADGENSGLDAVRLAGHAASLPGAEPIGLVHTACSARVSQIVSLTGFSFVGGPAMNDSHAAVEFLDELKVPLRSMVSLDIQTIESWESSRLGLNPVQTAMQVAIPEIDGATEPFIFGGMPRAGFKPEPIEDRCRRIARRIARWNRLQTLPRSDLKLAMVLFCFPPNKGNIGTAAELDVFPSLIEILRRLEQEGYTVEVPPDADALREMMVRGQESGARGQGITGEGAAFCPAAVAYRLSVGEYKKLCPYAGEVEREWGPSPGQLNSDGKSILIQGIQLGSVFIGVQPTFGYEGDPMRMLAAEGGGPHHGFMGFYTYIEKVFQADAVIHVGTHGALEFMPGKQAGLSSRCWPDRLIGEVPNIYIYSVNNPSEGTIAKRRSYGELISYLTPPMDNAGLYKGLASLKEMILAYRQSDDESDRERLYQAIEEQAKSVNLGLS